MGYLAVTPAKPTGGVLHGCKRSNHTVRPRFMVKNAYFLE